MQRYFTTIALISTVFAALLMGWFYQSQEKPAMQEIVGRYNALFVQSIANTIIPEFQGYLRSIDGLNQKQILLKPRSRVLDQAVREKVKDLSIIKVEILNDRAKVLYSTSSKHIGNDA